MLCLTSFAQHVSECYPRILCISVFHLILLLSSITFYGFTQFVYPFSWLWTFVCFQCVAIIIKASINICVQVFVWIYVFISLWQIPRNGIAQSYGKCILTFYEIDKYFCKDVPFHTPTCILWRVPVVPHLYHHWMLSSLFNFCYSR